MKSQSLDKKTIAKNGEQTLNLLGKIGWKKLGAEMYNSLYTKSCELTARYLFYTCIRLAHPIWLKGNPRTFLSVLP